MKIVIEGCDGVGKTSVVNMLAKKYGCDVVHMTGDDPKDCEFYHQSLRKNNVIYDRNVIGEMVYPRIFGRQRELSHEQLADIINMHKDVHFFVLTANPVTIQMRLSTRGTECPEILNSLDYINAKFKVLAYEYGITEIDTTQMTQNQVVEEIEKIINEKENHKNVKEV